MRTRRGNGESDEVVVSLATANSKTAVLHNAEESAAAVAAPRTRHHREGLPRRLHEEVYRSERTGEGLQIQRF